MNRRLFTLKALPFSERFVRRGGKHSVGIPSHLVTAPGGIRVKVKNSAPFGNTLGFAAPFNQAVDPLIVGLLTPGSPAAVSGLVVPVIINAVDTMPRRPLPHVFKKRLKTIAPAVTNLNAACSVIPVVFAGSVFTSLNNAAPYIVHRRSGAPMRARRFASGSAFFAPATARFGSALLLHEKRSANLAFCATLAATQKNIGITMDLPRVVENRPAMELLSGEVSRHLQMVAENKAIGKEEKNNE